MKMKRSLLLCAALVMSLVMAIGGTLAYLQDTDEAVNVMTLGNVDIEQIEMQRAEGVGHTGLLEDGDLEPFEEGKPLYPAYPVNNSASDYTAEATDLLYWGPYVTADSDGKAGTGAGNGLWNDAKLRGAVDKMVFVKNVGTSDAYYRTVMAFECPEGVEFGQGPDKQLMMNVNINSRFTWEEIGYTEIDGVRYLLMVATYNEVLLPGEISRPSLLQVVMTHNATNETVKLLGDTYEILVLTQGVQAQNFANAVEALEAAFGEITVANHPWAEGGVVTATTDEELLAAIKDEDVTIITVDGDLTYDWGSGSYATSGALLLDGKIIKGADADATITFKGYGSANPITGATLMNITVIDETVGDDESAWEHGYLELENVTANNVVFEDGVMLRGNSALINCTIDNQQNSWYACWVDSGNAVIRNCTFTGTRAVKIHEAYSSEVTSVLVDGCSFTLSEKPGVVIGTLNAATSVTIQNSTFDTQAGDQGLYIYETDTDVTTFTFAESGNDVK